AAFRHCSIKPHLQKYSVPLHSPRLGSARLICLFKSTAISPSRIRSLNNAMPTPFSKPCICSTCMAIVATADFPPQYISIKSSLHSCSTFLLCISLVKSFPEYIHSIFLIFVLGSSCSVTTFQSIPLLNQYR